jgi:hypothetical protein
MQSRDFRLGTQAIVAATAMLLSTVTLGASQDPPSAPVTVVNTPANPVPVRLQGTGTISGSVNAVQSGSWSVGVTNTVAVKNSEDPGRSPFSARLNVGTAQASCLVLSGNYQSCDFTGGFPVVPAGKRLVITDFSGQSFAPSGCFVVEISLSTSNEGGGNFGNPITYAIPHQSRLPELFNFHERMLAFVEPGSSPFLTVTASCPGLSVGQQIATISGYFVNLP